MTSDELEIRQLFISDEEWNRTSETWKALKPHRNFNQLDPSDETPEQYCMRLTSAGFQIPRLVIDQWLYPHYYDRNTVNNYGWLDYSRASWTEVLLPVDTLLSLNVIQEYRNYVESRAQLRGLDHFMCIDIDLEHWKRYNTWRMPPVVLDVNSLLRWPSHAEIGGVLQLIEGHTRLGYLNAAERSGVLTERYHKILLLKQDDLLRHTQ